MSSCKATNAKGNVGDHKLGPVSVVPEPVHRLQMIRPIPVAREDWAAWERHCPKPADWVES